MFVYKVILKYYNQYEFKGSSRSVPCAGITFAWNAVATDAGRALDKELKISVISAIENDLHAGIARHR